MYDNVESDFWKEIFVHMQHKNMMRQNATKLTMQNAQEEFEHFELYHPEIKTEITNAGSYVTWEIFVTNNIKLRLFIQSQIKASFLIKENGDLTKIADAKFPNNPFPEILEMLKNKNVYERELHQKTEEAIKISKKQKLIAEFIKANLKKKYENQTDVMWNLEIRKEDFLLKLTVAGDTKEILLKDCDYLTLTEL